MQDANQQTVDPMHLTNDELVRFWFKQPSATLLENELLHRLEAYISMYGYYLDVKALERY